MSFRRRGRINMRPWKRPPWKRRAGEWLIPDETTAASLLCASPWGTSIDVSAVGTNWTSSPLAGIVLTPILLTSAAEDTISGQPLWPQHTVERVRGTVFVFQNPNQESTVPSPFLYHYGVRLVDADEAGQPDFSASVLSEKQADDRWVARGHFFVPGVINGVPAGPVVAQTYATTSYMAQHRGIEINIRNRVKVKQDQFLLWFHEVSGSGASALPAWAGNIVLANVVPYLRTYIRQS